MQAARDVGAFLRRLFWFGVVGGLVLVYDGLGAYERFIKGGPFDPATWPEPLAGWSAWVATAVDNNLLVLLLVAGSFIAFRDARRDRRTADEAKGKAETRADKSEGDLADLRRLYDGLVARGVGEMWSRRESSTATEEPDDEPTIAGTLEVGGAFTSTSPEAPRSRRKSKHDPPDPPPSLGL